MPKLDVFTVLVIKVLSYAAAMLNKSKLLRRNPIFLLHFDGTRRLACNWETISRR